jgi:hypothetical protein
MQRKEIRAFVLTSTHVDRNELERYLFLCKDELDDATAAAGDRCCVDFEHHEGL